MKAKKARSTFLPKVVEMCWNSTKWWFFGKIVVGMTSFLIVGVSDFTSLSCRPTISRKAVCWFTTLGSEVCPNIRQGSPIPTKKLEICWSPTILPNNGRGRCTEKRLPMALYTSWHQRGRSLSSNALRYTISACNSSTISFQKECIHSTVHTV